MRGTVWWCFVCVIQRYIECRVLSTLSLPPLLLSTLSFLPLLLSTLSLLPLLLSLLFCRPLSSLPNPRPSIPRSHDLISHPPFPSQRFSLTPPLTYPSTPSLTSALTSPRNPSPFPSTSTPLHPSRQILRSRGHVNHKPSRKIRTSDT
jgi:hypothetical protein